jgi:hypothetical protein
LDLRLPRRTEAGRRLGLAVVSALALAGAATARAEEPKAPDADRPKLSIKWSTSSEVDNYGFWVMRGDSKDGPFKPAHPKIVAGAGNSDLPRKYSFDDLDVEMGKTYYYYLDAISTHGVREKYSPIIEKKCCDRPGEKAPESRELKPEETGAAPAASPSTAPPTP